MALSKLDQLYDDSQSIGLSEALDAMTAALKLEYATQVQAFLASADRSRTRAETILELQQSISSMIPRLRRAIGMELSVDEFAVCMLHKSVTADATDIFEIFRDQDRARHFLRVPPGNLLFELALSVIMYRRGLLHSRGVAFVNYAINFIKRAELVHKFWVESEIGPVPKSDATEDPVSSITGAYYRLLSIICDFKGIEAAIDFVRSSIDPIGVCTRFNDLIIEGDPKTFLQEYVQWMGGSPPKYDTERLAGSDHQPVFEASTMVPGGGWARGRHSSKSGAAMRAAETAVIALGNGPKTQTSVERFRRERLAGANRRPRQRLNGIPKALVSWIGFVHDKTGVSGQPALMTTAIMSPALAAPRTPYEGVATNEALSLLGSKLLEATLESLGERQSLKRLHPLLLDDLASLLEIDDIQRQLLGRDIPHGRDRRNDAAQAVLWALYETDPSVAGWLRDRVRSKFVVGDDHVAAGRTWPVAPHLFDDSFSYVQALQEFTQAKDRSLPTYRDQRDIERPHAPTHHSIVTWGGLSGEGIGKRVSWSRNMAAHALLMKLTSTQDD